MAGVWRRYLKALDAYPLLVKSLSAGTLVAVGDCIAQVAIERRSEYDLKRTGRMFAFGLCVSGPTMHYWYGFLGGRITGRTPLIKGLKTMLVDQTVYAPFIIACFFSFTSFLEGMSPAQVKDKLKQNFLPSIKGNYLLWPAAQLVNFTFVPTRLAVLYVSGVSVVWNTWLCYMSAKDKQ